jgi:hypothetical protein
MNTQEMIQAAATIASGMVGAAASRGQIESTTMNTIARTAVELALKIEEAARRVQTGGGR